MQDLFLKEMFERSENKIYYDFCSYENQNARESKKGVQVSERLD